MTGGLIDDEQGGFRAGMGCVDQIFTLKQVSKKEQGKKRRLHVGFMDLEKPYDRVNREVIIIWGVPRSLIGNREVLKRHDVGGKPLNGIKSMHVNSLICVRVKGCEIRLYHVPLAFQCIRGRCDESENRDGEEGREWRLPGLLYAYYLGLCDESEEDLKVMGGRFVEVRRRRGPKLNAMSYVSWHHACRPRVGRMW